MRTLGIVVPGTTQSHTTHRSPRAPTRPPRWKRRSGACANRSRCCVPTQPCPLPTSRRRVPRRVARRARNARRPGPPEVTHDLGVAHLCLRRCPALRRAGTGDARRRRSHRLTRAPRGAHPGECLRGGRQPRTRGELREAALRRHLEDLTWLEEPRPGPPPRRRSHRGRTTVLPLEARDGVPRRRPRAHDDRPSARPAPAAAGPSGRPLELGVKLYVNGACRPHPHGTAQPVAPSLSPGRDYLRHRRVERDHSRTPPGRGADG